MYKRIRNYCCRNSSAGDKIITVLKDAAYKIGKWMRLRKGEMVN